MGFYIRKSIRVGPLRFNLSGSGIGVSAGFKGFRVGTGPRGNYVQMGFGGIYFRQTIPVTPPPKRNTNSEQPVLAEEFRFKEIESASVAQMVETSAVNLLAEIDAKAKAPRAWPWVALAILALLFGLAAVGAPAWFRAALLPICMAALAWSLYRDSLKKTIVLFYELEPHIEEAYQNLHNAFAALQICPRLWHIDATANVTTTYQWKVTSGASHLVKRTLVKVGVPPPSYFKCNIAIPSLSLRGRKLYFLPDRILIWDSTGVGSLDFPKLNIDVQEEQFIESGSVPDGSIVVGSTWRYVNKKGGPDRRFNNNYEIPILLYELISLAGKGGLNELLQASRVGIGVKLKKSIEEMSTAIARRQTSALDEAGSAAQSSFQLPRPERSELPTAIKFSCPSCGQHISSFTDQIGVEGLCPGCGQSVTVPHAV